MAVTLTHNLRLRIDSNLTANSKYNLERLDLLGATFLVDTTNTLNLRSQTNILIEPESPDLNGSGVGGVVSIGTPSHQLAAIGLYASVINTSGSLAFLDQATGGTKYLALQYKSDLNGLVDNVADRHIFIDVDGANRDFVLGGDFQLLGGSLTLNLTGSTSLVLPTSGTLSTLNGVETLTNKTINGLSNVFSNIAYSSLTLSGSIVNSDIGASAGISYSKLNLTGGILNSDVSPSAGIVYSKLNLTNSITNTDISGIAGISGSKITADFGNQQVGAGSLAFNLGGTLTTIEPAQSGQASDITFQLPPNTGTPGQLLTTDGSGNLSWSSASGTGSVTSVALTMPSIFSVGGSPVTSAGTLAVTANSQAANLVYAGPASGGAATPTFRALTSADLPAITGDRSASYSWLTADGVTKTITHNWGTRKICVEVLDDSDSFRTIDIADITRPTDNTLVLTSNIAPASSWTVLTREVQ